MAPRKRVVATAEPASPPSSPPPASAGTVVVSAPVAAPAPVADTGIVKPLPVGWKKNFTQRFLTALVAAGVVISAVCAINKSQQESYLAIFRSLSCCWINYGYTGCHGI